MYQHDLSRRYADFTIEIVATEFRPRLIGACVTLSVSTTLMTGGYWFQFASLLKRVTALLHSNHRSVQWVWSSIFTCSYSVFSVSHLNGVFHVVRSRVFHVVRSGVVASESLGP